jgi:steroid delta-isomerase-like uncharacterized protein
MSTEQNRVLVRRRVEEIWHQGNLAAIDDLIAADLVSNGQATGREGFRQFVSAVRMAFPDLQFTIEDIVTEGDKVCVRYVARGTQQGEFAGLPASGKPVQFTGIDIFRIADGQFAEEWLMYDQFGLLQQLGALPSPGQPGA